MLFTSSLTYRNSGTTPEAVDDSADEADAMPPAATVVRHKRSWVVLSSDSENSEEFDKNGNEQQEDEIA
jgi:hypothetical protein